MNCRESRFQLALFVGGDLDESSSVGLQRHLATCPECRDHHDGLSKVMDRVEQIESQSTAIMHAESVWPQLAAVIKVREQDRTRRFNGWVAGFAVAATILATVTIAQNLPSAQPLSNFGTQFSDMGPMDNFSNNVLFQPGANMLPADPQDGSSLWDEGGLVIDVDRTTQQERLSRMVLQQRQTNPNVIIIGPDSPLLRQRNDRSSWHDDRIDKAEHQQRLRALRELELRDEGRPFERVTPRSPRPLFRAR